MKKLVLFFVLLSFNFLSGQNINEKGLYVNSEGDLFSGKISKIQDGVKAEYLVEKGIINGEVVYYAAGGTLLEKGMFNQGQKDQQWTRYNTNGTISAIAFYKLGKKTGTWLVFDETGKKRFEMNYNEGQKTGVWTNWDENGQISSTKDYSKVN